MPYEKKDGDGGLWPSDYGPHMSGEIFINGQTIKIVAFPKRDTDHPKAPAWRISKAKPREDQA